LYQVHPISIWVPSTSNIDLAHRDRVLEFDSADEPKRKVCLMAVPPSRALLVAELPVSGRARVRVMGQEITAKRTPSKRRAKYGGNVGAAILNDEDEEGAQP
jgi:hypothetical protein